MPDPNSLESLTYTVYELKALRDHAGRRINSITMQRLLGAEEVLKWLVDRPSMFPRMLAEAQNKVRRAHADERKGKPGACPCPVCRP
jgi:hypothetical protein